MGVKSLSIAALSLCVLVGLVSAVDLPPTCPRVKITKTQVLEPVYDETKGKLFFGQYVKMFGDWMVIGAYGQDSWAGAAYVFQRVGDDWVFSQLLGWEDSIAGGYFGLNLAITETNFGEPLIVVGAPFDNPYQNKSGSAHIYDLVVPEGATEAVWTETQKIIAPGNGLGHRAAYNAYAVGASGDYIVLGSRNQNHVDEFGNILQEKTGAFYVYKRLVAGGEYQLMQVEFGPTKSQQWGDEIRIHGSRPGEGPLRILLGSPRHRPHAYGASYSYLYNEQTAEFELEQVLIPDESGLPNVLDGNKAHHGEGISLTSNPESLCTGGERAASDKGTRAGGVYCYEKDENGVWQQGSGIYSDKSSTTFFGQRLQRAGEALTVGAWQYNVDVEDVTYSKAGAAFVFTQCSDKSWYRDLRLEPAVLNESTGTYDYLPQDGGNYGKMIDMSSEYIAVGAPKMSSGASPDTVVERGAVYMYKYEVEEYDGEPPLPTVNDVDLEPLQTETTSFTVENCPGKKIICPTTTYSIKINSVIGCALYANDTLVDRAYIPETGSIDPSYGTSPDNGGTPASFTVPTGLEAYSEGELELRVTIWSPTLGRTRIAKSFPVSLVTGTDCSTAVDEDILTRFD